MPDQALQRRGRLKGGKEDGTWATVGVLVNKSAPRESASGNMYSVWHLSDLDGACPSVCKTEPTAVYL